jgi:meso-butanediol dehydrogenase/(S,S)-butanediol dehydrogenase/diacetyl reductase
MRRFEGRTALVTGAASGIGRATAERLAAEGAQLALCDVQTDALEETGRLVRARGAEVLTRRCDVANADDLRATVAATVERFGALRVLCNVAGVLRFEHTHEVDLADWNRVLAINLTGTFLACQAALPHLLASHGTIVNVSSAAALFGYPWTAAYSASKGGVLALTHCLAIEYGKQGVRVNAVCPGGVLTPIHGAFKVPAGADPKLVYRMQPLDEMRGPETAASVIAFLASDDAAHVNGEAIRIDGATHS